MAAPNGRTPEDRIRSLNNQTRTSWSRIDRSKMNIQLQSTQNITLRSGVKVLIYGNSGVGKTRCCATAPNPIFVSAEGGLLSLRKYNLPYIEVHSMTALQQAYQWCLNSNEGKQFGSIVLDSISEIAEVCLRAEQAANKDGRKAYGELLVKIIGIARDFRDIPGKNVIITAKQEWSKDDSTGMMIFGPMMPGSKLGPQLPYFWDEVFQQCVFLDPQTKQRSEWLRTRTDGQNVAKDRSGALNEFEPPDLTKIFAKIAA
jgi:hypothetical protein